MKRLIAILAIMFSTITFAQPEPLAFQLELTTGRTVTDSVRIPSNLVPVGIELQGVDITNATTGVIQYSRQRVPTVWTTLLELDAGTDYTLNFADSSGTPFNPANIYILLGSAGSDRSDYLWIQIAGLTAEASDKIFTLICRYI